MCTIANKPPYDKDACTITSGVFSIRSTIDPTNSSKLKPSWPSTRTSPGWNIITKTKLPPTNVDHLSPSTQALLQALDSIQPSTPWTSDANDNTVIFTQHQLTMPPYDNRHNHMSSSKTHKQSTTSSSSLSDPPKIAHFKEGTRGGTHGGACLSSCSSVNFFSYSKCAKITRATLWSTSKWSPARESQLITPDSIMAWLKRWTAQKAGLEVG